MRYNFNWPVIWRNSDKLFDGLLLGLGIAVVALAAGCAIGILLAACRLSRHAVLRIPATVFVEVLRNTPLLLLVFFTYFGLPEIGITAFDNTECFTVTLAVYAGAYLTEVFRAGLTAIPVAYIEAGKAIGLTALQRARYVVLPVLFRIVLPSLSSALISLFKDTALAAAIGVPELTYGARWIKREHVPGAGNLDRSRGAVSRHLLRAGDLAAPARTALCNGALMEWVKMLQEAWRARHTLLGGLLTTLEISALVIVAGTIVGVLIGLGLCYGGWLLRSVLRVYVDVIRGIPSLVLIFFSFYGTALLGLNISAFAAGVLALGAFCAAHVGELTRGAVQSIPHAQTDAAKSIGLGFWGRLAYAILPQALRRMLPAWVNIAAEMVKGSTLLSLIGVLDLLLATQQAIARTFLIIQFYTALMVVYFCINFAISRVGAAVERRMAYVRS